METKEFTIVHVNNLKIDDLYSLIKSTIEYADRESENIGAMPNATFAQLKTANQYKALTRNIYNIGWGMQAPECGKSALL